MADDAGGGVDTGAIFVVYRSNCRARKRLRRIFERDARACFRKMESFQMPSLRGGIADEAIWGYRHVACPGWRRSARHHELIPTPL